MLAAGRFVPITRTPRTEGPASIRRAPEGGIVLDASGSDLAPSVRRSGERYDVRLGEASFLFERHEMQRLTIEAGARAKEANIGGDVDVPVRVRDEDGRERVFNKPPKQGTIKIFGKDWGSVGVISPSMIDPSLDAVRGKEQSQVLNGTWSGAARVDQDAWSLDATAELLAGGLRC